MIATKKVQNQRFSGVVTQHQNEQAERVIQTIMYMACNFMVRASLHCSERGSDYLSLWSLYFKHTFWLYNRLPSKESGLTPL